MTDKAVWKQARKLLTDGWVKNAFEEDIYGDDDAVVSHGYCVLGALGVVLHEDPRWFDAESWDEYDRRKEMEELEPDDPYAPPLDDADYEYLEEIAKAIDCGGKLSVGVVPTDQINCVAHWNDTDERTLEEVLDVLDSLAAG